MKGEDKSCRISLFSVMWSDTPVSMIQVFGALEETHKRVTWTCQSSNGWRRCDLCSLKLREHLVVFKLFIWHKYTSETWGNLSLCCISHMSKLTNLGGLVVQLRAYVSCVSNLPAVVSDPHILLLILCSIMVQSCGLARRLGGHWDGSVSDNMRKALHRKRKKF